MSEEFESEIKFWLIQRIQKQRYPGPNAKGIDKHFSFDYMGSAEFEWKALPKALKKMREQENLLDIHVLKVVQFVPQQGEKTIKLYLVGTKDHVKPWETFATQQINRLEGYSFLQEQTRMDRSFTSDDGIWMYIGWWAIDHEIPSVIFTKRSDAEKWLNLLRHKE